MLSLSLILFIFLIRAKDTITSCRNILYDGECIWLKHYLIERKYPIHIVLLLIGMIGNCACLII